MPNCRFNALLAAAALVACALVAPVATAAPSQSISPFVGDLHWRLLGPFRGGWSTMAEGIPDRPNV
ncbi:MAG: hypothetical protein ACREPS_10085, partial [Rhodanobacteraceae bacterium]